MSNPIKVKTTTRGLTRLSDGRWQIRYRNENGRERRVIIGTSKTVALNMLASIRTRRVEGRLIDKKDLRQVKFELAVERFLEYSRANLRQSTANSDERIALLWLSFPAFKGKALDEIKRSDVEAFKTWRGSCRSRHGGREQPRPISRREVDLAISRLKRLFNLAIAWELCEANPAAHVKFFHADDTRRRVLQPEEEARLYEAAARLREDARLAYAPPNAMAFQLETAIRLSLLTGMRRGELLSLKWKDVDLANGIAMVPGKVAKGRRDRLIHLNSTAVTLLRGMTRPIDHNLPVFGNSSGKVNENLERSWRKVLTLSGIEDFRWHDLRHTYASRLVMSGVSLFEVKELLGHRGLTMTLRYAHLEASRLKSAVRKLDEWDAANPAQRAAGDP